MRIAICGAGTVGSGVAEILQGNRALIEARTGSSIDIEILASRSQPKAEVFAGLTFTSDVLSVCGDENIDVVVELMGGTTDAKRLVEDALKAGKSVVTANKALIAEYGEQLFELAESHGVQLRFEAAVAGSIPIIKVVQESLAGNRITQLAGIINGTANFILTEMAVEGSRRSFLDVLSEAQALGYAEADPTFDVEGIDAAHKLAILGGLAFDQPIRFKELVIAGITQVDPSDFTMAKTLGYCIKHLGIARKVDAQLELVVGPCLVPMHSPLASVDGVRNGVLIESDAAGETLCTGPGAGAGPTGSAVVSDLIDLVREGANGTSLGRRVSRVETLSVLKAEDSRSAFYLRMTVTDESGVIAALTAILAARSVSLDKIFQQNLPDNRSMVVLITDQIRQGELDAAIEELLAHKAVVSDIQKLRVY